MSARGREGRALVVAILILVSGCGGAAPGTEPGPSAAPAGFASANSLIPAGYGTLTQSQFTLQLEISDLQIQITPLAESVIRLAAPDTYQRLTGLSASAGASLGSRAPSDSRLFLVSMFSRAPTVTYEPDNLHIVNGGFRYRPLAIEAITPGWGGQRLRQQETQLAVYAFDPGVELEIALTVEYDGVSDPSWQTILNRLESERARVRARIGA